MCRREDDLCNSSTIYQLEKINNNCKPLTSSPIASSLAWYDEKWIQHQRWKLLSGARSQESSTSRVKNNSDPLSANHKLTSWFSPRLTWIAIKALLILLDRINQTRETREGLNKIYPSSTLGRYASQDVVKSDKSFSFHLFWLIRNWKDAGSWQSGGKLSHISK